MHTPGPPDHSPSEGGRMVEELRWRNFDDFRRTVGDAFETFLAAALNDFPASATLIPAMRYSLLSGGKRVRPLLCLSAFAVFSDDVGRAMPAAAAVEMVHAYSLIHDDLPCMDDDDLRRGRPTNHKVFGEAMALLAGDGLLTHAFELVTQCSVPLDNTVAMVRALARAAGPYGMVGGQAADMSEGEHSPARLAFIHAHKTGRLIQAAIDLGALAADAPAVERSRLLDFGEHVGQAFQMMDDWLDVCGAAEVVGKSVGHDSERGKLTYPALFGADETRRMAEREFASAMAALEPYGQRADALRAVASLMVHRSK